MRGDATTSAITYRNAGPDDAADLSALAAATFRETFGHLYAPEDLAAFFAQGSVAAYRDELEDPCYAVRFAYSEDAIAGFVKIGPLTVPVDPAPSPIELRQLYVHKPWQGAGVAGALFDWALAEARARGGRNLYLSVFSDNPRARRFYERRGFAVVGRYHFMVGGQADDELIMHRAIAP